MSTLLLPLHNERDRGSLFKVNGNQVKKKCKSMEPKDSAAAKRMAIPHVALLASTMFDYFHLVCERIGEVEKRIEPGI